MSVFLIILAVVIFLAADYFIALEFYKAAVMKGWTEKKYFLICFLVPPAGHILVAALPDRGSKSELTAFTSSDLPDM